MGLFSALRNRLFGPPAAPSGSEDSGFSSAEAAPDLGDGPPSMAQESADPAESTSSDVAASEAMPNQQPDQSPASTPEADDAVAARQERAATRILDDERLRGDLTDDEFQPLLDWALKAADRLAASTAGQSDEQADRRIDGGLSAIREAVAAAGDAVTAYVEHDPDRLRKALADAGIGAPDQRTDATIARIMTQRDLSGPDVAAVIASRLAHVTADTSNRIRKASS